MISTNGITIDRKTRTIRHRGRTHVFECKGVKVRNGEQTSYRFKIFTQLVVGGGLSIQQIFWNLHANNPDGGPLSGPDLIRVQFDAMKPLFAKLDLDFRATKIAGVTFYELVPSYFVEALHARAY